MNSPSERRRPDVTVTVGGYDCTGSGRWTLRELEMVARVFRDAAEAIRQRKHGELECPDLVLIGIDFGGAFTDEDGLPSLKTYPRPK